MNVADAGVVAVVAISALIGFARGFIREVFGIGAWIGAIVLAIYFHELVASPSCDGRTTPRSPIRYPTPRSSCRR